MAPPFTVTVMTTSSPAALRSVEPSAFENSISNGFSSTPTVHDEVFSSPLPLTPRYETVKVPASPNVRLNSAVVETTSSPTFHACTRPVPPFFTVAVMATSLPCTQEIVASVTENSISSGSSSTVTVHVRFTDTSSAFTPR